MKTTHTIDWKEKYKPRLIKEQAVSEWQEQGNVRDEKRKRWEYQTTWPASWEIIMQVKMQQLELDMEQQTGSK